MTDPATLTHEESHVLKWVSWLTILIGVMSVVAGVIVLLKPSDSLETLAVISGIFVLIDGVVELVAAIAGATPNRGMAAIVGVISAIVGVLLIRHPVGGVTFVALLLATWLIAAGVVRIVIAFERPDHRGRGVFVGAILALAGIVIVASPHIGFATLALFTGIGFIGYGVGMLLLGFATLTLRRAATA